MVCLWWFLVVFVCFSSSEASWVDDLVNSKSVEIGRDVSISIRQLPNTDNASYLASHALHIELLGIGISLSKAHETDGLDVGLYLDEDNAVEEGNSYSCVVDISPYN